jgi:Short C-terminal domain
LVNTTATAAGAPTPRPRDAAFFEEQEYRLRALKRLRDLGLISEEEYLQKRREVLEQL